MTATTETLASGATLERSSNYGAGRYGYDWGECSVASGYAQVDTRQDASYYGTWANPFDRIIVNYCEGDVTRTICHTDAQFIAEVNRTYEWNLNAGYWIGIDGMCNEKIIARFTELGFAHLLH